MKRLTNYVYWLNVGLIGLASCDRVSIDLMPAADPISEDNQFVALVDQQLAIDLKKIPGLTTTTTFRIQKQPDWGDARFTAQGLLVYTPKSEFVAGDDEVVLTADQQTGAGVISSLPLLITMATADDPLPCQLGAVSDKAETVMGTAVSLSVLQNDVFCQGTVDAASLTIESLPENGTVQPGSNGTVLYTPKAGYKGRDSFIYKVCNTGTPEKNCSVAAVTVTVIDPAQACSISLEDNVVVFKPVFAGDSIRIPVLANDILCRSNKAIPISLALPPVFGSAYINKNNVIVYKARVAAGSDELTYRRCDGACLDAVVVIQSRPPMVNCTMTAASDSRTITLANLSEEIRTNGIYLSILANDTVCNLLKSITIKENPSNLKLEVQRDGSLLYRMDTTPKTGTFSFVYELTDVNDNKASAEMKIIVK
ncbi:Ig-like domain-containing protein [Arsenicibacter rosenii]|uniref:Tandem-95 repeat protein n=1 Tax=Arsenicibacter rosenii TaxID=1750698 RepID=A0A1S2VNV5_9BACT|nr:Ig-like domain-containing protein [Arsenicibacter rosenii]OIN60080.1 hypothetical protein BLX24_04315 [Arsenicibacter rosenii]